MRTRNKTSAGALWTRIEQALSMDIASGKARPGTRIETEHLLAERFRVNRHTVRQALGSLAAKGLVRVERGVGTFVADFALEYVLGRRTRFSANLSAAGLAGRHRLLLWRHEKASRPIAEKLGLRSGASVIYALSQGEARGRAISLAEHWFPGRRFAGLMERFEKSGSLTAAMADLGVHDYVRARSAISARLPDETTQHRLSIPGTRPVLVVEAVNVDRAGVPIEFGRTQFCADRVQLVVEPGK